MHPKLQFASLIGTTVPAQSTLARIRTNTAGGACLADRVIRCKGDASPLLPWPAEGVGGAHEAPDDQDSGDDDGSLTGVD